MRLRTSAYIAILLISWGISTPSWADTIFVELATGTGVSESDLATATTLVSTSVGEVSSDTVVNQPDQADITLRPTLVRLGEAYLLGLSKVKEGKIVSSSQLKALRMDELDKVADRLTRSVLIGENAKKNPRVGEITAQEALDGAQRRPTRNETYLSFGPSEFGNLNSTGIGYSIGLGHAWDVNVALIKLIAQADINGDAWMATAGLGANYFFSVTNIAPYVTGDFGAGAAKVDGGGVFSGETTGGFAVGAGAGVQFLRTSSVNLDVGFRAGYLLHSNQFGLPQSYSLKVGVYF